MSILSLQTQEPETLITPAFDSGIYKILAHPGWSLHVGLHGGATPLTHKVSNNDDPVLHL